MYTVIIVDINGYYWLRIFITNNYKSKQIQNVLKCFYIKLYYLILFYIVLY